MVYNYSLPKDGLHHQVSEAKRAREAAKLLDKKITYEQDRWNMGTSRMSSSAWAALYQASQDAWEKAEGMSKSTGFPFKDRSGNWVNKQQRDLVGISLKEWCKQHSIEYV